MNSIYQVQKTRTKTTKTGLNRFSTVMVGFSQSTWTTYLGIEGIKNCILLLHRLHYCTCSLGVNEAQWPCRQAAGARECEQGSAVACCHRCLNPPPQLPERNTQLAYMHASGQVRTYQHMGSMLPVFDDVAKSVGGE